MQWLIDIIVEAVLKRFKGIISEWHGLLVDIPDGWVLCDGNNGTPDLREKFILGTAAAENPGDTGGTILHTHPFTSNTHKHLLDMNLDADGVDEGDTLIGTQQGNVFTETSVVTGTTDAALHLPPYYKLAFIMKT